MLQPRSFTLCRSMSAAFIFRTNTGCMLIRTQVTRILPTISSAHAAAAARPTTQMFFPSVHLSVLRLRGDNEDPMAVSMVTSWHNAALLTAV